VFNPWLDVFAANIENEWSPSIKATDETRMFTDFWMEEIMPDELSAQTQSGQFDLRDAPNPRFVVC
jgi:hypothetical protein